MTESPPESGDAMFDLPSLETARSKWTTFGVAALAISAAIPPVEIDPLSADPRVTATILSGLLGLGIGISSGKHFPIYLRVELVSGIGLSLADIIINNGESLPFGLLMFGVVMLGTAAGGKLVTRKS